MLNKIKIDCIYKVQVLHLCNKRKEAQENSNNMASLNRKFTI